MDSLLTRYLQNQALKKQQQNSNFLQVDEDDTPAVLAAGPQDTIEEEPYANDLEGDESFLETFDEDSFEQPEIDPIEEFDSDEE